MRILTLSQLSLAGSSGIAEAKIPLWWADGTVVSSTLTSASTANGFITNGSTSAGFSIANTATILATLSSSFSPSTKYAFEVTLYAASGQTANAALWDSNTQTQITSVSTTSTTATVVRSGQFTLTPGHGLAVSIWCSATDVYIVDASLIIFP